MSNTSYNVIILFAKRENTLKEFILLLTEVVNALHDLIGSSTKTAGLELTDKDLHLWVFGIVGLCSFLFVHFIFRILAKYSVTSISFIYTFSLMVILVFAIEIQQKITGRGKMEFDDAVVSLWGFLLFFAVFLFLKGIRIGLRKVIKGRRVKSQ